ncbi:MAG TPA: hypothetical protein VG410_15560 [Solirubrobacteraceae bacterium]|nr:hypothetical protein [Solirubrobacteraceae bacterium]
MAVLAAGALAGCGGGDRMPTVGRLPLAPGSRVVSQVRECNSGSNAYCAVELVVVNKRSTNSLALIAQERQALSQRGWTSTHATNGDEHAALSPGDKLRVTYATAYGDLKDIELGWISRAKPISLALSHALFARAAAMSVILEIGS